MAARLGLLSTQTLQDEPVETYSLPSGPKAIVRVEWPWPEGRLSASTSRLSATPSLSVSSSLIICDGVATYTAPSLNAIPCTPPSPSAKTPVLSATPSLSASGRVYTEPWPGLVAYTTPSGERPNHRAP